MPNMNRVARVGLTGGIGSGKSTVATIFSELGVPILDLDTVGRNLALQPNPLAMLVRAFGDSILHMDGTLDRQKLASVCFSNTENTKQLNQIMHPLIWQITDDWLSRQQACYALIEASVLIESGGVSRMDDVVVMLASESLRHMRVLDGRNIDAASFNMIARQQCNDDARYAAADYVIENHADLSSLQEKTKTLHHQLMTKYSKYIPAG